MSRKVKTFFHVFLKSFVPHSNYYSKIIKSPFVFSLKYFLMLLLVLNIGAVLFFAVKYNPVRINSFLSSLSNSLSKYPSDLIITIHKGRLITSYNRPYLLWFDDQNNKNLLLVVDESATAKKIEQYNSYILLTSSELVANNTKTANMSSLPLTYLNDQKITKEKISQFVQTIGTVRSLLPLLFIVFVLLLTLFVPLISLVVTSVYLFLSSLIVFLVFKLFLQKHFKFRKILQISLHAATFPLFLDYSMIVIKPTIRMGSNAFSQLHQIPFPMLFLIILAVFVALGVYEAHAEENQKIVDNNQVHPSSTLRHKRK